MRLTVECFIFNSRGGEKKYFIDDINVSIESPPQAPIFSDVFGDCGGRSPPENVEMLRIPPPSKVWKSVRRGGILSDIPGLRFSKEHFPKF